MTPLEYDKRHVWHPYASLKDPPRVRLAAGGEGVEIVLADGRRLVDGVSSWWCVAHGHNHPAIVEAVRRQSERLCHVMFGGFTHEPAVELAERIASMAPKGLNRVFFADSGSISVEVSVKMAIQYQQAKGRPSRCKMVALKGGYHGDTACAMALSDPDGMHVLFRGMMPRHHFAPKPDGGLEALGGWTRELERVVDEHDGEIAGIICEPAFQAANAMNFYPGEYLAELRRICDERDLVLVFDEIAAGLWRTGPRWAHECGGASPDVMCIGKALTGGHMTLAATVASERVADVISSGDVGAFMHGPTYMANPLACAAANASLDLFARFDYGAMARRIEGEFNDAMPSLAALPNVKGVRVKGAVGIVEVGRLPSREDIDRVIDETGVWLRPFANFIYAMPPLVSDSAAIRRVADALSAMAALPPGPEVAGDFHE
jgi:adenosylmethionine-8-amino-7-oxononanoate aminotransferase